MATARFLQIHSLPRLSCRAPEPGRLGPRQEDHVRRQDANSHLLTMSQAALASRRQRRFADPGSTVHPALLGLERS